MIDATSKCPKCNGHMYSNTIASGAIHCDKCSYMAVKPWIIYELALHNLGISELPVTTRRIL